MTLLHIGISSASPMRHDESSANGFMLSVQIFGAVFEIWVGI
jgi:hypothetical protein